MALRTAISELRSLQIANSKVFLSVADVSALLGIKPKTVYNAVNRHSLSAYKPEGKELYFDPEDVKKYAFRNKIRADYELTEMAKR